MIDKLRIAYWLTPVLVIAMCATVFGNQGKDLFDKQCASCHTIGGGDAGGPDLKGVAAKRTAEWLIRVIVEPEKLTAEKDAVQIELVKKYGYEMPNLGISSEDARKIAAYLGGGTVPAQTTGPASPAAESPAQKTPLVVTPELIAIGRALFTGEKKFSKRGAPCIACHAFAYPGVKSANLASDLTMLYEGMGEQGVKGVLKSLKFPIMKRIYDDKPLSDDEIAALTAFIKDAGEKKSAASGGLIGAGAAVFAGIILGLTLYKRRIG